MGGGDSRMVSGSGGSRSSSKRDLGLGGRIGSAKMVDMGCQTDYTDPSYGSSRMGSALLGQSPKSETQSKAPKHPLTGHWVCEAKRWYDGSVIEINGEEGTWRPLNVKSKVHRTAEYSRKELADLEWELTEHREGGGERKFRLHLDQESTSPVLTVVFQKEDGTMDPNLKFVLVPSQPLDRRVNLHQLLKDKTTTNQRFFDRECSRKAFLHNVAVLVGDESFDAFVGCIITINSVCIGFEIDYAIRDEIVPHLATLEICFLVFYIVELTLRFIASATEPLRGAAAGWVAGDCFLVFIGLISLISSRFFLEQVMIFRVLRLLRVVRAVRHVEFLQPLWKLVSGLLEAMATLSCTMVVIAFILYIFACVGGEVIAQDDELRNMTIEDNAEIHNLMTEHFSSMGRIMLTLVQFTTADITDVYFPLITAKPWLALYFGAAYLVITILLMNLVTAVLVEDAIARAQDDQTMKNRKLRRKLKMYIPELTKVFDHADHDGTGDINMEELLMMTIPPEMEKGLSEEVKNILKPTTLEESYDCFDADASGLVSKEEFIEGGLAVLLKDAPQEMTQLLQLVRSSNKQLKTIQDRLDRIEDRFIAST